MNSVTTTPFDSKFAADMAQIHSAEAVAAQECCDQAAFWHVALVVGMIALAAFGLFLAVEWPALMIPVCVIVVGKLLIDLFERIKSSCCTA